MLGFQSVWEREEGWSIAHSMQRKLCEKIEGGAEENGVFGKLQTIPRGRITEFQGVGLRGAKSARRSKQNRILEGHTHLLLESVVLAFTARQEASAP